MKESDLPEHANLQPIPETKDNTDERDKPQILNDPPKKKNGVKLLPKNAGNKYQKNYIVIKISYHNRTKSNQYQRNHKLL